MKPVTIFLACVVAFALGRAEEHSIKVFVDGQEVAAELRPDGTIVVPSLAPTTAPAAVQPITVSAVAATPQPVTAPQPTAIKGKLTWQKNVVENRTVDPGAQVWLVPADQVAGLARAAGGTAAEPIPQKANGWEAKLTGEYKFPHAITDGDGAFAFYPVAPGNYLLIVKSRRANGLSPRDRDGKVRFLPVTVHAGVTTDAPFNFGVTAYRD